MTITDFSIEYDAINSSNTFTNGDTINGRIIVAVSKEMKIQSLIFRGKGKARVCWHEHYGQHQHHVYWATEKYYDVTHQILREARQDGTEVIGRGRHVFPFSFKIPDRHLPSTFKDSICRITHKVKAELKQSMKFTKKTKAHFTFVSKADLNFPRLMEPQSAFKDKELKVFGSGTVSMDAHTKKMGYMQGEDIQVTIDVNNRSSRSVKPKIILYEKRSYFAQGRRKVCTKDIIKEKADAIESSKKQIVSKVINIPKELPASIVNCSIFKLEYRVKFHLDIKCALDPEVKLPIIVLPEVPWVQPPPAPAFCDFGAFPNPNQPTWSTTPHPPTLQPVYPPPSYEAHTLYPPTYSDYKGAAL